MLCNNCNKNIATFHYKKIVNGEKTEINLCSDCALELGYMEHNHDVFDFGSVLNEFLGIESQPRSFVCKTCGMDYNTFKKTGKIGCEGCFAQFEKMIDDILPSIQAGKTHTGKKITENSEEFLAKKKLDELKLNLKKAISDERYEDAALIRDEIKKLSSKEGE